MPPHSKYSIKDLSDYAKTNHKGRCLSSVYLRNDTKYTWKCNNKNHPEFESQWGNVNRGQWCKLCADERFKMDFGVIQQKVKEMGGKLISKSKDYVNNKSVIKYYCGQGHKCESSWGKLQQAKIENGRALEWCSECSGKAKYKISQVRELGEVRGGILISQSYKNNKVPLHWKCANEHEFKLNVHNLLNGQWCRKCSSGIGEEYVRYVFEGIFKDKFPKVKPNWLGGLELDGYNEKLNLAFEFQGIQHHKYVPVFHPNGLADFDSQLERDKKKRNLCKRHGVKLILVDFVNTQLDKLTKNIVDSLKTLKLKNLDLAAINKSQFYKNFYKNEITELKKIARNHGGKCLSKVYFGESCEMEFECASGHVFNKKPSKIRQGIWCLKEGCHSKAPASQAVVDYITRKGGKLLSKYVNRGTEIKVECDKGHVYHTTWGSLQKSWCSICSGNKKGTIEEMRLLANSRGGVCLSSAYLGSNVKLDWQCAKGHRFPATPGNVKHKKSWCIKCR
jgi:hypothetical protein